MKNLPSLKQLEYLTTLAETQHFGQAAERCNITPSTLSAGIRDLEAVLGVAVAERTKRSVLITPVGLAIAERARKLLNDAEDIMEVAATKRAPMTGQLRLGVIPTIGPYLLPSLLPAIDETYPDLRLLLREETTAKLLSRLHDGALDVALIALPYQTDPLMVRPLFEDTFQFACNKDHPLASKPSISDADLAEQPLLLLEEGHCLRSHALDACKLNRSEFRVQFEATSLHTLVQMVGSGIGVTLLPQMAIDAGIAAIPKMQLIPLDTPASRQIGLVWRPTAPKAEEFELLADLIKKQGGFQR